MKRCMGCMRQMADYETICPHCGYEEGTDVREAFYLLPGTGLKSRYIVGRVLGCGGFGVTYISYDQMLARPCAIKEYFPGTYATRGYGSKHLSLYAGGDAQEQFYAGLDSFMDEAKRQASLQRIPGIVRVYDSFRENNTGYIVMDLLEGKTIKEILRDRMQQRQNAAAGDGVNANAPETAGSGFPFSYEEAETIIREVLKTLSLVHAEGIIHRDIAPDNIFITNQNEIKLIDFGAARYAASQKTRSLSVILKPGYGPEEQYRRHGEQGPWTDVYGVGATFYKMLTGKTPMEAMDRLIEDRLIPPSKLGVAIRPQQEKVLLKSLGVRKEQRYQSAEEFRNALERAAGPSVRTEPQDRKQGKTGKPMHKGLLVAIVIAICALGAAAGLLVLYDQQRRSSEELAEKMRIQEETIAASKESERRAQEESEKAESERKAKEESEKAESERKAKEESERAESERQAKEESERAESERQAKEESERAETAPDKQYYMSASRHLPILMNVGDTTILSIPTNTENPKIRYEEDMLTARWINTNSHMLRIDSGGKSGTSDIEIYDEKSGLFLIVPVIISKTEEKKPYITISRDMPVTIITHETTVIGVATNAENPEIEYEEELLNAAWMNTSGHYIKLTAGDQAATTDVVIKDPKSNVSAVISVVISELTPSVITDTETIKKVQQALKNEGYDVGRVDGIAGGRTALAVTAYEKAHHLKEDGLITDSLLEVLDISNVVIETEAAVSYDNTGQYNNSSTDYEYTGTPSSGGGYTGDGDVIVDIGDVSDSMGNYGYYGNS